MDKQKEKAVKTKIYAGVTSPKREFQQVVKKEEIQITETPLQKYQRVKNSLEFKSDMAREVDPSEADYELHKNEALALYQKKQDLEKTLETVSEEEQNDIKRELDKVQSEYKDARLNAAESMSLMMANTDSVYLKYFTPEEFHEAIFQMAESGLVNPTPVPLPTKEEGEVTGLLSLSPEEWSEAERRLNAKGISTRVMPPPPQWLIEKYSHLR